RQVAIRVDYRIVAVGQRVELPLLVHAVVQLPLDDPGPVTGRAPRVAEHLTAGLVDDLVVAVGQRPKSPLLVGGVVDRPLIHGRPVAGRRVGVVQDIAAVCVDDVVVQDGGGIRLQQLPALVGGPGELPLDDPGAVAGHVVVVEIHIARRVVY